MISTPLFLPFQKSLLQKRLCLCLFQDQQVNVVWPNFAKGIMHVQYVTILTTTVKHVDINVALVSRSQKPDDNNKKGGFEIIEP